MENCLIFPVATWSFMVSCFRLPVHLAGLFRLHFRTQNFAHGMECASKRSTNESPTPYLVFFFFFEISMASNFPATSFSAAYFLRKSWDNLKVPAGVIKPSWKDSWKPAICVLFLLFHRITLLLQVVKLLFTWWDLLRTHEADHIARRILRRCRCKTSLLIRGGSSLGYIVHAVGNTKELIARDGPAIDPAF